MSSSERWGYLSLIRVGDGRPIALDLNVLTGEFRRALSKAVERACDKMESVPNGPAKDLKRKSRQAAAS